MARSGIMKFTAMLLVLMGLHSCGTTADEGISVESPAGDLVYSEIIAPVFVGRPLSDAYIGLSRLEDGEIRSYDYGEQSQIELDEIREEMRPARKYIYSRDNGLNWKMKTVPVGFIGADVRSPVSGEYLRLLVSHDSIFSVRSEGGLEGSWTRQLIERDTFHMFAPPVFIRNGKRVLVSCHKLYPNRVARVYYSDDDGLSWNHSDVEPTPLHVPTGAHQGPRWQNPGIEPTVVEMKDGRLWMILRTAQDRHYQCFSRDGGESWTTPEPSPFYGTITMPRIGRLSDGRLLFIWNNTTPLPELSPDDPIKAVLPLTSRDGTWEDVFTNRSALHAAISEDEGKTWRGFRELYLDTRRNAADYAESGGIDHSVHQSQFVETDGGKILVAFGQHPLHRAMVLFDQDWLYETSRETDFSEGLEDWCVYKFVAEIRGHCSFNRKTGAYLADHPDRPGDKVLHVRRPEDPSLLIENDGAVWNFPAGLSGELTTLVLLPEGSQGFRINLSDRWFNPIDTTAWHFAMYSLVPELTQGVWHELRFRWDGLSPEKDQYCKLFLNASADPILLPLNRESEHGISYVHFISNASSPDPAGLMIESVKVNLDL